MNVGNADSNIQFWTASSNNTTGSERMRITSGGNVGLGTTSPDSLLEMSSADTKFILRSTGATSSASIDFQPAGGASTSNQGKFTIRAGGLASTLGERLEFLNGNMTSLMTIASTGYVGIGTTGPGAKLQVSGNIANASIGTFAQSDTTPSVSGSNVFITANTAEGGVTITDFDDESISQIIVIQCGDANTTINRSNAILLNSANFTCATNSTITLARLNNYWWEVARTTPAGDLAEDFPTYDETLAPGEVVALDPQNPVFVKRASFGESIAGIISQTPALHMAGYDYTKYLNNKQVAVALAGRVPVKVSDENGPVEVGDRLTVSKTKPGYAMRASEAGMTIGIALEASDAKSSDLSSESSLKGEASGEGGKMILTLVNLSYWAPDITSIQSDEMIINDNTVNGSLIFNAVVSMFKDAFNIVFENGLLKVAKIIATKEFCLDDVCITKEQFKTLLEKNGIQSPNDQITETPTPEPQPEAGPPPAETPAPEVTPTSMPELP
ncbi:MAG: hypothetical protein A2918_03570 [Candidatus Yanofskybacteria bacterium RIFCSPLOWO2_01_FULL_42_49]|uniref:Uncharacterized protein n=1 Tax=Candidatus Yanofskybacteria bacterium RIFCSPLOWO2_01_FULL_42_49 TaxID=1802694 RepID=A0A1F8GF47_9BACT|nr:MAG: hypothetical protein A2918_03570 [Candidatus Yanofskybacteria bacterium RIFCSPLOWO2_01_FULL_42_49]